MEDDPPSETNTSDQFRWSLLATLHQGGAQLAVSEAHLAQAEAGLARADSVIARARAVLAELGIPVSPPTHGSDSAANLTAEEFASRVKMSPRRVRQILKRDGTAGIHYYMVGRQFRVRTVEAEPLFTQHRERPPANETRSLPEAPVPEVSNADVLRFRARTTKKRGPS